ncbi:MAG: ATP-binding protein [Haloferacaceae archaeon]
MSEEALDVVEFLLTVDVYRDHEGVLDENDLPPRFSSVFWSDEDEDEDRDELDGVPGDELVVDIAVPGTMSGGVPEETVRRATGVESPWEAFVGSGWQTRYPNAVERPDQRVPRYELGDREEALDLLLAHADRERIATNPVVAYAVEERGDPAFDVTRAEARENVPVFRNRRVYIDALLERYFDSDDDDDVEMLDLVHVRVPDEIEFTLDDLVLTEDQEEEIDKIRIAMEERAFLGEIGLGEIGKLLFVGPPGTGKTTVSRALAHELGMPFVEVKLSMITSQYLGETAKNVERTFEVAKRLSPCILFIDEFDSVAKTRRSDEHAALKRAVNTLLKSIDDISLVRDDVLLIGATNHPDQLDAAAWRRFDEIVNFPKPDAQMRADILGLITRKIDTNFDPAAVAAETTGFTGSDLRMVMREAVLEALREGRLEDGRLELTQDDLMDAVSDFEERDNLKNMDMIDGDADAMVAGDGGHDHSHGHDHDHDD